MLGLTNEQRALGQVARPIQRQDLTPNSLFDQAETLAKFFES
jgi:hypothetical protein